jgi:uncharacterized membrane protein
MSNLIIVTFENVHEAADLRDALREVEAGEHLSLDDSAILVKDEDGKIDVQDEIHRGKKVGLIGGGILGLLIASVFFPAAGLIAVTVAVARAARGADAGIDPEFIKDVIEDLGPGTSALFLLVREADPDYALAVLERYRGKVYHTSLPADAELRLREAMSESGHDADDE